MEAKKYTDEEIEEFYDNSLANLRRGLSVAPKRWLKLKLIGTNNG